MFLKSEYVFPPVIMDSLFRETGKKSQVPPAVSTPMLVGCSGIIPKMSAISYGMKEWWHPNPARQLCRMLSVLKLLLRELMEGRLRGRLVIDNQGIGILLGCDAAFSQPTIMFTSL
jgi:hypothetical protein